MEFSYNDLPVVQPVLGINDKWKQSIKLSSSIPYSGTNASSASGRLVNVVTANITTTPNWAAAKGGIALASVPAINAALYANLVAAAGVHGVVYIWDEISTPMADGQYVPFQQTNLALPGVFVQDSQSVKLLLEAASKDASVTLTLPERRIANTKTRTLYVIVNGIDPALKKETVLITTHTDGGNALEENGHIALLSYARQLKAGPPRRTTILVFVSGHMHYGEFAAPPGRASTVWLNAHPELWNGTDGRKAVFGSCVEHMGGIQLSHDLSKNTYEPNGLVEPEWLFASTAKLANLTQGLWKGVEVNVTRILDPLTGTIPQSGEGLPLLAADIPEVSLVTSPP
uniref:Peptide hydrolase n=1 Tax=Mycena chlorophos TaxID=658473 RepID=A0ABQ0M924_MYCCL|nr:predicted protein [Mycena chlorophos]